MHMDCGRMCSSTSSLLTKVRQNVMRVSYAAQTGMRCWWMATSATAPGSPGWWVAAGCTVLIW